MINPFKHGDVIRHINWIAGEVETVEAVSRDGRHLWLKNESDALTTYAYATGLWEKVEPFFELSKQYQGVASLKKFKVREILTTRTGLKYAVLEDLDDGRARIVDQDDVDVYNEIQL